MCATRLLYIGCEWHIKKTGSNRFLIDYLENNFEVDFLLDTEITESVVRDINYKKYDVILFFQKMPPKFYSLFECKNIVFVPMFDETGDSVDFAYFARNLKIIAFCKKHYEMCTRYGIPVFYLQYYPELDENALMNEKDNLLFWQRRDNCTWSTVKKLIGEARNLPDDIENVYVHSAVDNGAHFEMPSEKDKEDYNITVTSWFADKSDFSKLLDSNAIFVAPRDKEGIGMSFLDAMAKGAVVIAHNESTMNEYINNDNGYLIDFCNPEVIDLSTWKIKQRKSIESVIKGRQIYENRIKDLASFISNTEKKHSTNLFFFCYYLLYRILRKCKHVFKV